MNGWTWHTDVGEEAIQALAEQWNALAHSGALTPASDAIWTRCMWRGFGVGELVIHQLRFDGRLCAVLPLQRLGRWVRVWTDCQDVRATPYWSFAVDEEQLGEIAGRALDHLLAHAEAVWLRRLHADGPIGQAMRRAAEERGLAVDVRENGADAYLKLPDTWEDFLVAMSVKLRKNTERAVRQLEKLGELRFQVVETAEGLSPLLDECFELEALGWKATDGETIVSRDDWSRFYRELPPAEAEAGRLALYTLRLDDRLLAFDLCVRGQQRINLLKISYHPEYARYSPSNVLRYRVFQHEIERRDVRVYHFGDPSEWKLRWTDQIAPLVAMRIHGSGPRAALGRMEQRLRSQLRTALRGRRLKA